MQVVFVSLLLIYHCSQEAFDGQGQNVRAELSKEQKEELDAAFKRLSPDRVQLVLAQIYQCIVLLLIPHSGDEDYASPGNYS